MTTANLSLIFIHSVTKCNERKSKALQYPITQIDFIYDQHANNTNRGYDRKINRFA